MANLVTLSRLMLLAAVVIVLYSAAPIWQVANVFLLIAVFVTDGIDGYVARKRNEASRFGAVFDIASDRIVEWTMWIVFVDLDLVPLWVLLLFVVRGIIVDAIRSSTEVASPFATMTSKTGRWLVAGRFMRVTYSVVKAVTFCWLLLSLAAPAFEPGFSQQWARVFEAIASALILATAGICVARGLPVIMEFVYAERNTLLGSLAQNVHQRQAR